MPVSRRRKPKKPPRVRRTPGNPAVRATGVPPAAPRPQPAARTDGAREWLLINLDGRPELDATHRKTAFFDRVREHVRSLPADAQELRDLAALMDTYPAPAPDRCPMIPIEGGDPDEDIADVLMEVLNSQEEELAGVAAIYPGDELPEPDWTGEQAAARDAALDETDPAEFVREVIATAGSWLRLAAEDASADADEE
jgi:hypothetical protein